MDHEHAHHTYLRQVRRVEESLTRSSRELHGPVGIIFQNEYVMSLTDLVNLMSPLRWNAKRCGILTNGNGVEDLGQRSALSSSCAQALHSKEQSGRNESIAAGQSCEWLLQLSVWELSFGSHCRRPS